MAILREGTSGEPVEAPAGQAWGGRPTASSGANTEKALMAWQSKNALTPDGVAGPDTLWRWVFMNLFFSSRARAAIPSFRRYVACGSWPKPHQT